MSRNAAPTRQAQILKDHGIQWSTLNVIPNWRPSSNTALDFMHNIYLGVIAHFYTQVLFAAHMFAGAGGHDSSKNQFEGFINKFCWPSHITRLPKNVSAMPFQLLNVNFVLTCFQAR